MRVAILHDWLIERGGSEAVLEEMLEIFPDADIYTLFHKKESQSKKIESRIKKVSALNKIPVDHRKLILLMPIFVEQFDLSDYDIVISNSFAVSQGYISSPDQTHFAYVNRTMRYAWDTYHEDLQHFGFKRGLKRVIASIGYHYLRSWDVLSYSRPDAIASNSHFSARRMKKYYGVSPKIIHPPVESGIFWAEKTRDEYFVTIGRLVPLKGIDIIIEAFNLNGRKLVVIGDGPKMSEYKEMALENIEFKGRLSSSEIARILSRCKGYIAMAEEDFGIANVEALLSGSPVIAWKSGAVSETIKHGENGILFDCRTPDNLNSALSEMEEIIDMQPDQIRSTGMVYSKQRFRDEIELTVMEIAKAKRREGDRK